ncbi:hypothetical protein ZWY2020_022466 [Hordeum vulgare]|nr:hypothetical protein ZWY2020_022466 [Hordeum vulgare]
MADQHPKKAARCYSWRMSLSSPAPPPGVEPTMEYVRSEDLLPIPSPKASSAGLVARLDSRDWIMVCKALNDASRHAIQHPPSSPHPVPDARGHNGGGSSSKVPISNSRRARRLQIGADGLNRAPCTTRVSVFEKGVRVSAEKPTETVRITS